MPCTMWVWQKYTVAVLIAGLAIMPVAWQGWLFPLLFWLLMMYNAKTVQATEAFVRTYGADGAAARLKPEPFPPKLLTWSLFR